MRSCLVRWCSSSVRSLQVPSWREYGALYVNGINHSGGSDAGLTSFAQAYAIAFDVAASSEHGPLFGFLDDFARRPVQMNLSQIVELTAYEKAGRAGPRDSNRGGDRCPRPMVPSSCNGPAGAAWLGCPPVYRRRSKMVEWLMPDGRSRQ